ncbi:MAG TPA: DUF2804 domain-containing protein [Symbiobacteriaceae bacterium]|nr:DUF2804 domain-containing protein [Symbiobacteriaceae bacterium]
MTAERELTQPVRLCDDTGRLNAGAVGWSRHPVHTCNLRGAWLRKKRWNYWCITTDRFLFSITLSNLDYMAVVFVYFLEYATKHFHELTVMNPLGRGVVLPETVAGQTAFRHRNLTCALVDEADATRISVASPLFGGAPMEADLLVARPPGHETMNVVIPWAHDRFQFTSKQLCLPVSGQIRLGGRVLAVEPGEAFACLDFGRGIWPYSSVWNWGAFSGLQDGRLVGVNLGGKWTDGTGMTENAVFLDGRISKLHEPVEFVYSPGDFMKPWRMRNERVDLTFAPFFERVARTDLLILRSEVHQMIGRYTGTLITDDGARIAVKDLVGWAEEHKARW